MARSREAYVDTAALIAFIETHDAFHGLFVRLFSCPPPLVTTPLVIAEGHAWSLKRHGPMGGMRYLAMIEDIRPMRVVGVGARELRAGAGLIRRFGDQRLTLTDAVGLHTMHERRVTTCWSTDFHLGLTGVPLVIHGQ